ncbi:hypothetical protein KP509_36G066100 [Ceratopteris richardii]|uniref:Uncharacterized protein n=1 Tax=Ceratopteris richardii TaxID=49495 RepID=A0A8T2QCH9_CERRI|nr:hypothetical protein KP509_36G066100 [Ceratopteris richardii]
MDEDDDVECLSCLEELYLDGCTALTTLSCLSTSLHTLVLQDCCNLERLNLTVSLSNFKKLYLRGCTKLTRTGHSRRGVRHPIRSGHHFRRWVRHAIRNRLDLRQHLI